LYISTRLPILKGATWKWIKSPKHNDTYFYRGVSIVDFLFRRSYRGALKMVVLDWAGTTVDFGCFAPAGVFSRVFAENGVEISMREAREPMGLHKRDHIRSITQMERVAAAWTAHHGRACTEADVEAMFERFVPLQLDVIADHAELIPEVPVAQAGFRRRQLKIGTTTGYNTQMMEMLAPRAKRQGYEPDFIVCASEVPAGRPAPWMALRNAEKLGVYPLEACVKIGDTPSDIAEGLNAGMWSVGVLLSSNELGMSQEEIRRCPAEELARRKDWARQRLLGAGAHFVIDTLGEVNSVFDEIEKLLKQGERP
jgi:phosphonoacetaldehyde hydrolase